MSFSLLPFHHMFLIVKQLFSTFTARQMCFFPALCSAISMILNLNPYWYGCSVSNKYIVDVSTYSILVLVVSQTSIYLAVPSSPYWFLKLWVQVTSLVQAFDRIIMYEKNVKSEGLGCFLKKIHCHLPLDFFLFLLFSLFIYCLLHPMPFCLLCTTFCRLISLWWGPTL